MVGTVGHLLILFSMAATGAATWFYFRAVRPDGAPLDPAQARWQALGRKAWLVSVAALAGASAALMYLILTHQFQYSYVHSYTSLDLPFFYTFSAFWAGQEGSFLLWILLNGLLGLGILLRRDAFEAPVMAVVALCQLFLVSMILGLDLGSLKLGVSPFQTLAQEYPDAAQLQGGYVPADGQGLNDLLQNPWMVIHPPVLFVGFAAMLAPFAYAVAGLWTRRYTQWVYPALPWTLFANLALMAGIALGGYWAYITLSFGGYWAWDPVENTSLVPWLVSVGAIHAMLAQRKSGTNHKAALLLNIAAFLLVIYSTFLTRSGVLSDLSVHSFTDLGLYNQLLLWILTMSAVGFGLYAAHHRRLPVPERETNLLSREFLLFTGAVLMAALGVVILVGTSAPIIGRLFQENPSAVDISFYNQWSVPLTAGIAFVAGLAQLVWWRKMTREQVNDAVFKPMLAATVCTAAIVLFTPLVDVVVATGKAAAGPVMQQSGLLGSVGHYWDTLGQGLLLVLLIFTAFFALFSNGAILWRIGRGNPRMAGGAVTHIGFLLMVFGILTSSVFNNALSDGRAQNGGQENFVLERGQTRSIEGYAVTYTGAEPAERGRVRYGLTWVDPDGRTFEAHPIAYKTTRNQWMQSPDTKTFFEKDIFIAVSPRAMFEKNGQASANEVTLLRDDSVAVGEGRYVLRFDGFDLNAEHADVPEDASVAVAAAIGVTDTETGERHTLRPIYYMAPHVHEDGEAHEGAESGHRAPGYVPARVEAWGLAVTLRGLQTDGSAVRLAVEGAKVEPADWVVVQAYEKPFINILWFGTVLMLGGFGLAIFRRFTDDRQRFEREQAED